MNVPNSDSMVTCFFSADSNMTNDLRVNAKTFERWRSDQRLFLRGTYNSMRCPILNTLYISCQLVLRFFLYQLKQGRNREQVIFDHMQVINKMQHFCLRAAAAVNHAMYLVAVLHQALP